MAVFLFGPPYMDQYCNYADRHCGYECADVSRNRCCLWTWGWTVFYQRYLVGCVYGFIKTMEALRLACYGRCRNLVGNRLCPDLRTVFPETTHRTRTDSFIAA